MTDLQATLDAIDEVAVHQCGYCSEPLSADSESLDYCSDECQAWWLSERHEVQQLVGYEEPDDLPVHAFNLTEMYSPEVAPERPDHAWPMGYGGTLTFDLRADTSQFAAACQRAETGFGRLLQCMLGGGESFARVSLGVSPDQVILDELHGWQLTGSAPEGYQIFEWAASKPECQQPPEVFGSDFDFEHRTAATLPDEPPAAVMPDLPARDWQAIVDARVSHTGPRRVVRAPRHLGRTR